VTPGTGGEVECAEATEDDIEENDSVAAEADEVLRNISRAFLQACTTTRTCPLHQSQLSISCRHDISPDAHQCELVEVRRSRRTVYAASAKRFDPGK
jgi:hypothetical protein